MGHHGSKEQQGGGGANTPDGSYFQKQKSNSAVSGSKKNKKNKPPLSSAVSVSSNDSSLVPAFVIESENDVDCRGLTPWSSRENLLQFSSSFQSELNIGPSGHQQQQINTSDNIHVAQFDYSTQASNQLSFHKGDLLKVLGYNDTGEWCEAQLVQSQNQSPDTVQQLLGWVPFNYIAPVNSKSTHSWYHGPLSKIEAEHLLLSGVTGSFLVRESEGSSGTYTISLRHDTRVYHYRINYNQNAAMYFISEEAQFETLEKLIHHHSKYTSGLRSLLKYPAAKRKQAPPPVWATPQDSQSAIGNSGSSGSGGTSADLQSVNDQWELDRTEIQIKERLGSGQYGDVYRAVWTRFQGGVTVAVKTLREGTCSMDEFMQEAQIMKTLRHDNLVQLLGVCTREMPIYIITEFMPRGNLLSYVRSQESLRRRETQTTLMFMSSQIAAAMAYLESMNYIHRDLAARNCLVGDGDIVKVADFGLSRLIGEAEECYQAREGAKFPIKWTAPESLAFNKFSTKSDVWAFGVLLWEIASGGMSPYPGVELCGLYEYLQQGSRLSQPLECPNSLYTLMRKCWQWLPRDRPSFAEINYQLASLLDEVRQELDGQQGATPQSPEKTLDQPTLAHATSAPGGSASGGGGGGASNVDISSGAISDDSFEGGISCGSHTPDLDSPEGTLDHVGRRSTSGAGNAGTDSDSGIGGGNFGHQMSGSTPDSDTDSNARLRHALFSKKNAPAPPMRTSSFQIKESPSFTTGVNVHSDSTNLKTLQIDTETGSSPLVGRQNPLSKTRIASQVSPSSSDSLSTFKRPSTGDDLINQSQSSTNVPEVGVPVTSSEIRSMKTMSVYHHNQSSDSEDDVIDPNQLWKPSGLLQKASSNADISNNPDYGFKNKPSPNPRVYSSRDMLSHPNASANAAQKSGTSSFGTSAIQSQSGSTFSTFGSCSGGGMVPTSIPTVPSQIVSPNKPLTVKLPASQHGYTSSEIVPQNKSISTFSKSPAPSVGLSNPNVAAASGGGGGGDGMWKASIPEPPKQSAPAPISPVKVTSPTRDSIPVAIPKPKPAPPTTERTVSKPAPPPQQVQGNLAPNIPTSVPSAVNKESPKGQRKLVVCPPPKPAISKPQLEVNEPKPTPPVAITAPVPPVKTHSSKAKNKVPNLNDDLISPPPLVQQAEKTVQPSVPPKPTEKPVRSASPERRSENLIKPSAFKKAIKSQEISTTTGAQSSTSQKVNVKHGHSKSTIDEGALKDKGKLSSNLKKPQNLAPDVQQHMTSSKPDLSTATDPVSELKSGVSLRQSVRRPQIATLSATETDIFSDVDLDTLLNIRKDIEKSLKIAAKWDDLNSKELSVLCAKLQRFHECCKNYSMVDLKVFSRRKFTERVTNLEGNIETLRKSAKLTEASNAITTMLQIVLSVGEILNSIESGAKS